MDNKMIYVARFWSPGERVGDREKRGLLMVAKRFASYWANNI